MTCNYAKANLLSLSQVKDETFTNKSKVGDSKGWLHKSSSKVIGTIIQL
jgi:hypothetical protein